MAEMVEVLENVKIGNRAKLPEWPDQRYLFSPDGACLFEMNFGLQIEKKEIKQPWIDRSDWEIITND